MEGKRLDFNAPLLSVRRFAAAPAPAPPSSSSSANAAAAASSGAEAGGGGQAGESPRRSLLPFYRSELKSGPVRNPGVVPFVWEQTPGRPKDGSFASDFPAKPADLPLVAAPKPPPGRIPRRPPEKEEPISTDAPSSASSGGGALPRRSSLFSSSTSTLTTTTSTATATSTTSLSSQNGTLPKPLESFRKGTTAKVETKPVVGMVAEAPISKEQHGGGEEGDEEEEEDAFSDALDTLSRAESSFMNCSISGMSLGMEAPQPAGSFSTDPQVRDFMMGRFLPAAQAVATGSPQCGPRKAPLHGRELPRRVLGNGGELRRPAAPLPYQHRPNHDYSYPQMTHQTDVENGSDDDDDDDVYEDSSRLPVKGCGLLPMFCLRSSSCLLNPVPGMKVRGRMPLPAAARRLSPQLRTSHHGPLGDAEDEHTWEEVYKHKLGRVHQPLGEEGSKVTSESNQLSNWSDSQTPEGSSPYGRSNAGGVSPYRNDMPPSPFDEGKGFLGVPKCEDRAGEVDHATFESCAQDGGRYWEIAPHVDSEEASGSPGLVLEKTVYVDSVQVQGNPDSVRRSLDSEDVMNCTDRNSEIGGESWRIETSPVLLTSEDNALQCDVSKVVVDELHSVDQLGPVEQMDDTVLSRQNHVADGLQDLKSGNQGKNDNNTLQALLPPPLPKSPSESWLWRTLPSISAKSSTPQSFVGFQFHPRKQATRASSTDPRWETMVKKTSALSKGRVRFADVLTKSANID